MSDCHCNENHDNSSFLFGLIIGAVIGAVVAILLYRQNKGKILAELKKRFQSFVIFDDVKTPVPKTSSSKPKTKPQVVTSSKKEVDLPPAIIKKTTPPAAVAKKSPAKRFLKPGK